MIFELRREACKVNFRRKKRKRFISREENIEEEENIYQNIE